MVDWLLATLTGFGVAYVISRVSIYIHLQFFRNSNDDFILVDVYLPHRIHLYSMKVPIIEIVNRNNIPWLESKIETEHGETKTHSHREQRFIKVLFDICIKHPQKMRRILKMLRYYQKIYCKFMHSIIKSIYCEKFYWKTTFGLEDAAATAILSGTLWSVKAMILTFLQKRTNFKTRPVIRVQPIFDQNKIEVDFQCIFSIKLGNLINASKFIFLSKDKEVQRHV
ncbi:DUF2953 domain-containing protein [bacterium BFN5]|nr:DUF2953 domain-containing protein [bacterium BFN5]